MLFFAFNKKIYFYYNVYHYYYYILITTNIDNISIIVIIYKNIKKIKLYFIIKNTSRIKEVEINH